MRLWNYKINSSVITASVIALIGAITDILSDGVVIDTIAEIILYFLQQPQTFKPYLTDRIYQGLITFLPIMSIFLRLHRAQGRPPIEKIENHE